MLHCNSYKSTNVQQSFTISEERIHSERISIPQKKSGSGQITTSGPVIIGADSFWYSITGCEESLLLSDDSAPNLRSRPT